MGQGPCGVSVVPAFSLDMLSYWEGLFSDPSMNEYIRPCLCAREARRRNRVLRARLDPGMEKKDGDSAGGEPWPQEGKRAFCPQIALCPI